MRWLRRPNFSSMAEFAETPVVDLGTWHKSATSVTIGASIQPLVEIPVALDVLPVYRLQRLACAPSRTLVRQDVADRLMYAHQVLPPKLGLTLIDGWRSLQFQAELVRMYSVELDVVSNGYVSSTEDPRFAPPHVTGGAVDLTLNFAGEPLALGTDFDEFGSRSATDWYEVNVPENDDERTVRGLRRVLARAMLSAGFAPYQHEWWHWSYGDQWWAKHYGRSRSLYQAITS